MKLLVILDSLEDGGVERQTLAYLAELRGRGHATRLVAPGVPALRTFESEARPLLAAPVRHLHWERPRKPGAVLRFAAACCRADAVLFVARSTLSGYYPLWLATRLCRPTVVVQQLLDPHAPLDEITRSRRAAHLAACHAVVAVSGTTADELSALFGLDRERLLVAWNGTEPGPPTTPATRRAARERHGVPADDRVLLLAGRLATQKGLDVFLRAFIPIARARPNVTALVAGDGPQGGWLHGEIMGAGLGGRIRLLGHVSDMHGLLPAGDFFVQASRSEGLSLALLEAMGSGLPAIATQVGGTAEAVIPGETGWLVPPGLAGPLRQALEDALALDPGACRSMAGRARERVLRRFSNRVHVTSVCDALEGAALGHARVGSNHQPAD